jgi:hypothetical protein
MEAEGAADLFYDPCAAGDGAPVAGRGAPRRPAGVSGAVAGRAAMDADHVANATGRPRRHRRRVLKSATGAQLDRSRQLWDKWDRDPSNYMDKDVASAFARVGASLKRLNVLMLSNFFRLCRIMAWTNLFAGIRYRMNGTMRRRGK